jgi:hypothetical protein
LPQLQPRLPLLVSMLLLQLALPLSPLLLPEEVTEHWLLALPLDVAAAALLLLLLLLLQLLLLQLAGQQS